MAYFDFLIDKGAEPKPIEYIYLLDEFWKDKTLGSFPIKKNSIVTNVTIKENGGYDFIIKETGEQGRATYAWAFAENTPDNLINIQNLYAKSKEVKLLQQEEQLLRNKVKTLKK